MFFSFHLSTSFYVHFQEYLFIVTYYFVQVTASEGQCHQESREEIKPDSHHVDTVITEAEENDDINIKLKSISAALQKGLKELGRWKNNDDKEEILSHMASFTLRSKVK
jgi:hypothetical protein